jgi:hypothetical protein
MLPPVGFAYHAPYYEDSNHTGVGGVMSQFEDLP